ncbi:MAG: saccharopine dehydrogenase NADP-binding domain-containing protein [Bacteroidetes bacterium]|nr:saccharopine dehydrogenase NADP-binding domain-containing protein [Bacteroidota bacterium]
MRFLVLGAGMMGSAVAYDLAKASKEHTVLLADRELERADAAAKAIGPNVRPIHLDVRDGASLRSALQSCEVVVSAVSYSVNESITRAAIEAGVHMCDLGGNNDVVDRQLLLDAEAREHNVTIVPNCGLAPGLINVLAVTGMEAFDAVDAIHLRVGGLPQHPRPPLHYQIVFSAEGLLNEYLEPAEILENGKLRTVPSLTGLEELTFPPPFGRLEAFYTSGGLSTLTRTLKGKVRALDYKTIRYPGHCEKFRLLLDLGFAASEPLVGGGVRTSRELFTELLKRRLSSDDGDVVLARAILHGIKNAKRQTLVYEFVDAYDAETRITAMMRTTAFPTAITALMIARGTITRRGVLPQELCVPGQPMIRELAERGIVISSRVSDETPR